MKNIVVSIVDHVALTEVLELLEEGGGSFLRQTPAELRELINNLREFLIFLRRKRLGRKSNRSGRWTYDQTKYGEGGFQWETTMTFSPGQRPDSEPTKWRCTIWVKGEQVLEFETERHNDLTWI